MNDKGNIKILFVCMGNICRSPTAHGVFLHKVQESGLDQQIHVDSAGTHAYHVSEPPDMRAQEAAMKRNIDLSAQRARRAAKEDFKKFDYILAMDLHNYEHLEKICPEGHEHKLKLFMEFAPGSEVNEVPDPYYGGPSGFERVLDLIEEASEGLIKFVRNEHGL